MLTRNIASILCLFAFVHFHAQTKTDNIQIKNLFVESKKVYDNASLFSLAMTYSLYAGRDSKTVCETYRGQLLKRSNDYYIKIGQTEFIGVGNQYLKIDNESKLMQYTGTSDKNALDYYDMTTILVNFKKGYLKETAEQWICTLEAPKFTSMPYGKAVVYIDKKTKLISKQVLYMLVKSECIDKKGNKKSDYGRIEINFSDFNSGKQDEGKLDFSSYMSLKNQKPVASKKYKDYQFIK